MVTWAAKVGMEHFLLPDKPRQLFIGKCNTLGRSDKSCIIDSEAQLKGPSNSSSGRWRWNKMNARKRMLCCRFRPVSIHSTTVMSLIQTDQFGKKLVVDSWMALQRCAVLRWFWCATATKTSIIYLPPVRPGVPGRPPPYLCWAALAGFRIWNEHMRVSSTVIIAPALSNSPQ